MTTKADYAIDPRPLVFVYGAMLLALYGLSTSFDAVNFFIGAIIHGIGFYAVREVPDHWSRERIGVMLSGYITSMVILTAVLSSVSPLLLMTPVMVIFVTVGSGAMIMPAIASVLSVLFFRHETVTIIFSCASAIAITFYMDTKIRRLWIRASADADRLSVLKERSSAHLAFVEKMSAGTFSETDTFSDDDPLGKTLFQTGLKLRVVSEEEQLRKWEMNGFNEINAILRAGKDTQERYRILLSFMVKHLNVNQGGLFTVSAHADSGRYLEMQACYAYDKRRMIKKDIDLDEGLPGQCVAEGEMIYLEQIPGDYVQITSGLGLATPTSLVVVPLKHNDEVVGVVELASLSKFSSKQLQFLNKASAIVGSAIFFNQQNVEVVRMLEASRALTAELTEQQEQARQNLEELQATQENLRREADEREKLRRELTKSREFLDLVLDTVPIPVFAKDRNHKMVLVNKAVCELNNMRRDQMLGKTDYDFFSRQEADVFWSFEEDIFRTRTGAEKIEHAVRNGRETYTLDKKLYAQTDSGEEFLIGINIDVTHSRMTEMNVERKYMSKVP